MANQKMDSKHYLPRFVDRLIQKKLSYAGAVEIKGPKWCGKTQSALQHAESAVMMQDPDKLASFSLPGRRRQQIRRRIREPEG